MARLRDLNFSDEFRRFLVDRMEERREDSGLAERVLYGSYDADDPDAMNWLDLRFYNGSARISYTTVARYNRAMQAGMITHNAFDQGSHRVMGRPASVLQKVARIADGDKQRYGRALDVFAAACAAGVGPPPDVTIVRGVEITRRYNQRGYCRCVSTGDMAGSCMRYDDFGPRFKLYEDHASLAVIICPQCNGTRARALLWTDAAGKRYLDRIYGSQANHEALRAWAKEHEYTMIYARDIARVGVVSIPAPNPPDGYPDGAPYLDSLPFWCRTCGTLSNRECERGHDKTLLRSTQAHGHRGWWGVCPRCGHFYGDHRRRCMNARACPGCGQDSCGECPNGCWSCAGCGELNPATTTACRNACITCACGYVSRQRWLSAMHGRCRNCLAVLAEEVVHDCELTQIAGGYRGECPECRHVVRFTKMTLRDDQARDGGLIACAAVHDPIDGAQGRHCPSCHVAIRWTNLDDAIAYERGERERIAQSWDVEGPEGSVARYYANVERLEREFAERKAQRERERRGG